MRHKIINAIAFLAILVGILINLPEAMDATAIFIGAK